MANYKEDLVDVELTTGNIHRSYLNRAIGEGDKMANRFGVRAFRGGSPESLSGTCYGYFIRSDGQTVVIEGTVSGNEAYVQLPATCYAVEGQFALAIKVETSSIAATLRIVDGVVSNTTTGTIVDPGTVLPTIETLLSAIEDAVASIPPEYEDMWTGYAPAYADLVWPVFAGQYCVYDQKLYRAISDRPTQETWTARFWQEVPLAEAILDLSKTFNAMTKADLMGRRLLPCAFGYGTYVASTTNPPTVTYQKYRVRNITPITVDKETTYTIADGYRVRRYWYTRSTGAWESFDGDWITGSFTLATDKIYYMSISRVNTDTSEVVDIQDFAQKVYIEWLDTDGVQKYKAISSLASSFSNKLANVNEPLISNIVASDGWTDLPVQLAGVFENRRYSGAYNIQQYRVFSNDGRREYIRIINRNTHEVYSDWLLCYYNPSLRILCLGDSLARGGRNSSKGFVGDLGYPYINMGVSGATLSSLYQYHSDSIHKWPEATDIPKQLTTYAAKSSADVEAAFGIPKFTPDVILAEGGINDYMKSVPMGILSLEPVANDTDAGNLDIETLSGALEYMFYQMIKLYPRAQRYFVITHKTYHNNSYYPRTVNSDGYTQQAMHDTIVEACQLYGVVPIDIYTDGIMDTKFAKYRSDQEDWHDAAATDYCDYDGVHPLSYGYTQVYRPIILEALKTATRK